MENGNCLGIIVQFLTKPMARELPFVVKPRRELPKYKVGSEESGVMEIARKGYLSVGEKSFFQGATAGDETIGKLHILVRKICAETELPYTEVFDQLQNPENELLQPYRDDILSMMLDMQTFQTRQEIVAATAMIISRVNSEWTVADTLELHPDIILGLYELYQLEDKRSIEDIESTETKEESVVASEGKDPSKEESEG